MKELNKFQSLLSCFKGNLFNLFHLHFLGLAVLSRLFLWSSFHFLISFSVYLEMKTMGKPWGSHRLEGRAGPRGEHGNWKQTSGPAPPPGVNPKDRPALPSVVSLPRRHKPSGKELVSRALFFLGSYVLVQFLTFGLTLIKTELHRTPGRRKEESEHCEDMEVFLVLDS